MCSQYQAVEIATLLPGSHIKEIIDSGQNRLCRQALWLKKKTRLPCIQTRCYWFVELEKRGNIPKLNCFRCQFKVPLSSHRSLIFQGVHILFQMPFIQCNNRLDVVCVPFLLGKDYEDHGTTCWCQTEESATLYKHCNRIRPFSFEDYWHIKTMATWVKSLHWVILPL